MFRKIFSLLSLSLLTLLQSFSQRPAFLAFQHDPWVNRQLQHMTIDEKIGQLMMIAVSPKQGEEARQSAKKLIQHYGLGGILVMQGTPVKTAAWINDLQEAAPIPLLVAMDAEWGAGFRMDSILTFPSHQSVGAIQDDALAYQMGRAVARQLKMAGINLNFAPVADINTNPMNPVINIRSFGEDRENVTRKAAAYAQGMQDEGVAAVAKHFPGHGDTHADSHKTLPVLEHNRARIDSVEFYPFRRLAQSGIAGIMTAHLHIPAYDTENRPASLSEKLIKTQLRDKLKFEGLVVTDAMNMKGVTLPVGKAEVQALIAGNDLLEFVPNVPLAIKAIRTAIDEKKLTLDEIDQKCRKILALKRWLKLNDYHPVTLENLTNRMNDPQTELTIRKLTEASLTVLSNNQLLPLQRLDTLKIATLSLGETETTPFQQMLERYTDMDHFNLGKEASDSEIAALLRKLENYNLIIAGVHHLRTYPGSKYGAGNAQLKMIEKLCGPQRVITLFFGNAYALKYFNRIENSAALAVAYHDTRLAQELAAQMIFGAVPASGRLPVTIDSRFKAGQGVDVKKNGRLKYTLPEEVGISSATLTRKIDSLARQGLDSSAYPGCQVLIAKEGKVIFHGCYGHPTFDQKEELKPDMIYDWASVTKVVGPLPALMKLVDAGKFDLNRKMSFYYPDFVNTNKQDILIRDVLTHQARLKPGVAWKSILAKDDELQKQVFKTDPPSEQAIRISEALYMDEKHLRSILDEIKNSPLLPRKKYEYSCLGFLVFPPIIESLTHTPFEAYLKTNFFRPLGATTVTYNAYKHFPPDRLVPTEEDDYLRMELLRGFVHDETAALLGGVSGNAGLFGSINDLAKIFQMYLQNGFYGGERYISEKTIREFTRTQFPGSMNRRGLGFDKPLINNRQAAPGRSYPAREVSPSSYGHSGYTGTFVWADPDNQLLFIFFSNRVYPTRANNKIFSLNTRFAMQQVIYDCIREGAR